MVRDMLFEVEPLDWRTLASAALLRMLRSD
jgi:hypothetical protein